MFFSFALCVELMDYMEDLLKLEESGTFYCVCIVCRVYLYVWALLARHDVIHYHVYLSITVFHSLSDTASNSMTPSGQCKLAPLILCVLDSCQLYDYIVKILFKMHTGDLLRVIDI